MSGKTIVLADDEQGVRTYVKAVLQKAGFHVIEAEDGTEALEFIQRVAGAIDLLLTDVRMPRMDGITLANTVTATYSNIPVLYISGYSFDLEAQKSRHPKNACGFVRKPFLPELLLEAVRKCMDPPVQMSRTTA